MLREYLKWDNGQFKQISTTAYQNSCSMVRYITQDLMSSTDIILMTYDESGRNHMATRNALPAWSVYVIQNASVTEFQHFTSKLNLDS